ncbi:MAG: hypothetical protein KC432_04580, partial [Thermomicrobiales bacterium]|nr:hypothetical protein [Thermomicrobiales bacterium]
MRRPSVAAAGFALIDGEAADPDGIVYIDQTPDHWGRLLLACVEPGEYSARGLELAGVALRTLHQAFAGTPGPAADALLAAFAAANDALLAENRAITTGRWERRICAGVTAVALQGREIFVGQAAPAQAILIQDQRVYAFPDLASWRGDYVPDAIIPESLPLGLADDPAPQIFQSDAAPGDLIALCATSVGHELSRNSESLDALYDASLVKDDLEGSVDRLERLMVRKGIVSSFAVVASVTRLGASQPMFTRRSKARGAAPGEVGGLSGADDVRAPRSVVARDAMIGAAERLSRPRPASVLDDKARRRIQAAPGAQSVRRYREAGGIPVEVRANLPRGPVVHVPARVLAISVALLMVAGGAGATVNFQHGREARAQAALAEVDRSLQDAAANPLVATSMVTQAEQALDDARASGADPSLVYQYARALSAVRDNAWNIRRLQDVRMLGTVPGAASDAPVRLALSGDTLYVAAGDLYELHPEEKRLLLLLAQGTDVGGTRAGKLRSVSIDGGAVIASDGEATYVRDSQGVWQRRPMAIEEVGGISRSLPVVSWGDAAYAVSWEGDLVRFFDTSAGPQSEVWATSALNPDLLQVTDFVIDGKIHLLAQDGRLLTFSRGQPETTVTPFVTPRLGATRSLAQAPLASQRYLVDGDTVIGGNQGRILRVDQAGNATQLLTPEDAESGNALANVGE